MEPLWVGDHSGSPIAIRSLSLNAILVHRGKTKAKKEVLVLSGWRALPLVGLPYRSAKRLWRGLPCLREITKRKNQLSPIQLPTATTRGVSINRRTIAADPIRVLIIYGDKVYVFRLLMTPPSTCFLFPSSPQTTETGERMKEKKKRKGSRPLQLDFVVFSCLFLFIPFLPSFNTSLHSGFLRVALTSRQSFMRNGEWGWWWMDGVEWLKSRLSTRTVDMYVPFPKLLRLPRFG